MNGITWSQAELCRTETGVLTAGLARDVDEEIMIGCNIFISYSHKDEEFRNEIVRHLKIYERNGEIKIWHDRKLEPGSKWKNEIDKHIYEADIILALVSSDFISSDYCYEKEMQQAFDQMKTGRSVFIPVIVRPVDLSESPFSNIQALPSEGKPVVNWSNRDEAWVDVAQGIHKIIRAIEDRKRSFIAAIPSVIREFPSDRQELILEEDSPVQRNISRLQNKNPAVWKSLVEYRQKVALYEKKLSKAIWEMYGLLYATNSPDEMKSLLLAMRISELSGEVSAYLTDESDLVIALQQENLDPRLFGLPEGVPGLMQRIDACTKLVVDNTTMAIKMVDAFKTNILTPVKVVGKEEHGDKFEDV